jgi:hypothetical protein
MCALWQVIPIVSLFLLCCSKCVKNEKNLLREIERTLQKANTLFAFDSIVHIHLVWFLH